MRHLINEYLSRKFSGRIVDLSFAQMQAKFLSEEFSLITFSKGINPQFAKQYLKVINDFRL